MNNNRTNNSIITFIVEMLFKLIITVLGIVKTSLIIRYLGDSVNGVYQLAIQMMAFVSVADLGLDSLYRYAYYKPLAEENIDEVNAIYNSSQKFYRLAGLVMFGIALFLSLIFPIVSSSSNMDWAILAMVMFLFAFPSVFDAFFSADMSLISAQQKNIYVHTFNNLKFVARLLVCIPTILTGNFFLFVVIDTLVCIIFTIIRYLALRKINEKYINHTKRINNSPIKLAKYSVFSSVNNIVYNGTDNLVISQFFGFESVSVYSSYIFVVKALSDIITISMGSIVDNVGNMFVTEKDPYKNFSQMEDILFYIALVLTLPLFLGLDSFIHLVISSGAIYQLDDLTYYLMVILFLVIIVTSIWEVVIKATGQYRNTWKISLAESLLNISISIVLGFYLEFSGILLGTIVARIIKVIYFNIVLGKALQFPRLIQTLKLIKYILICTIYLIALSVFLNFQIYSLITWFIVMLVSTCASAIIFLILCLITLKDFRTCILQIVSVRKGLDI